MNKKILCIVLIILVIAAIVAFCIINANKAPTPSTSGDVTSSGEVTPNENEEPKEEENNEPVEEAKDYDPYTANIPNEILDFYKEKIDEIEQKHKEDYKKLAEVADDLDYSDLNNLKYDLVFFNDDNIPELVVSQEGYRVTLYTYDAGKVVCAMEDENGWPYGAGGNAGYEYVPRGNVIRNYNSDHAGLIRYTSFYKLDNLKLVNALEQSLYETHYEDKNGNNEVDEDEIDYIEEAKYFYGDNEITAEEFEAKLISGEYEELVGTKSYEDIIARLNSLINEK